MKTLCKASVAGNFISTPPRKVQSSLGTGSHYALRSRIEAERAKIGSISQNAGASAPISASMAEYENLETERTFAEKGYESASQAVDAARISAERQSRYLTTFVDPYLPEDSLYPARLKMILLVLVCSSIAWAIGALIFYGIRDHSA